MDARTYSAKATPKSLRTRARILDAAMRLFAEVGYHAARMRTHSGGGMEEMLAVPDFERIAILEHGFPRPSNSWWRHAG